MNAKPSVRRHDLDWIRVLAIASVFFFHNLRFFDHDGWHVKNLATSDTAQIIVEMMCTWMMPLIFVISAASLVYTIRKGVGMKFFEDKAKRLLVPLVFGVFTIGPVMVYLERYSHHETSLSFFGWFPQYFDGVYAFGGNFAFMGLHLWYLLVLLLFTLLFLPVFLLLTTRTGKALISALAAAASKPGVIFLFALGIALPLCLVDPDAPWAREDMGGWSLFGYMGFFLLGFILFSDERFQKAIIRQRWAALIAVLGMYILAALVDLGFDAPFKTPMFYVGNLALALFSWSTIVAMLGFGMKHLTFENRFLSYASEAVLPFYWLHQAVILVIGYFVMQLGLGIVPKYILNTVLSFTAVMLIYEFAVRRVNVLRFLLGLKPVRKSAPVSAPVSAGANAG